MTREGPSSEVIASGGFVDVVLPETPSTGYRWELENEGPSVQLLSARFEDHPGSGRLAGGAGTRTFALHVAGAEPVELRFGLRRPWDSEPLERRIVTVTVTDDAR
jgi:predicted secreted protein